MGLNLFIKLLFILFVIANLASCSNKKLSLPSDIVDGDLNIMFDASNFKLESYTNNVKQFDLKTKRMTEYNDKRLVDELEYNAFNEARGHEFYTIGHIEEDRVKGNVSFANLRLIQEKRRLATKDLYFDRAKGSFLSPYLLILEDKLLMFGKQFSYTILGKEAQFDDNVDAHLVETNDQVKLYNKQVAKDEQAGLL